MRSVWPRGLRNQGDLLRCRGRGEGSREPRNIPGRIRWWDPETTTGLVQVGKAMLWWREGTFHLTGICEALSWTLAAFQDRKCAKHRMRTNPRRARGRFDVSSSRVVMERRK
ncbi:hypothetical protein BHE74_00059826 [Ensete ventricosum]|nr:hypothetical protein BHE74_00059826 [Ensete ventricosum]